MVQHSAAQHIAHMDVLYMTRDSLSSSSYQQHRSTTSYVDPTVGIYRHPPGSGILIDQNTLSLQQINGTIVNSSSSSSSFTGNQKA